LNSALFVEAISPAYYHTAGLDPFSTEVNMPAPSDRRYSTTHEWHKQDGDIVTVGITRHAVEELTDITYADLPAVGKQISAGQRFGEIESVKATAELYCAVAGEVVEANEALKNDPSLVNSDPYGKGWMIKVKAPGANLSGLMSPDQYSAQHGG
jgi:glycine cleavage system H protein